jgi:hypothetical protein
VLELRDHWFLPAPPLLGQFPAIYQRSPRQTWSVHTGGGRTATLTIPAWPAPGPMSCDHPPVAGEQRRPGAGSAPPASVTTARILLAVVAGYHLVVAIVACTHRAGLRAAILADHRSDGRVALDGALHLVLITAVAVNVPLVVLLATLVVLLRTGRPCPRRMTSVSQLFRVAFGSISATPLPALHHLVPLACAVQLAVILFLWAPRPSRDFFAPRRPSGLSPVRRWPR